MPTSETPAAQSKSLETTKSSESKQKDKSTTSTEEKRNVDEEKLRRFSLEQRTRGDTVEELKGHGVLVNRWQLPLNKSEEAGKYFFFAKKPFLESISELVVCVFFNVLPLVFEVNNAELFGTFGRPSLMLCGLVA